MEKTVVLAEYSRKRSKVTSLFKKYGLVLAFTAPFFICFIAFFLFPLFYGIIISLCNFKYSTPGVFKFNDFKWYEYLLVPSKKPLFYEAFWRSFLHTIIFAIIMVPVAVLFPLFLAILINKKLVGYKLFRCLVYLPSIIPLTASGTIFTMLFMPKNQHGLLAELFPGFGPDLWFSENMFSFNIGNFAINVAWAWIPIFLMCFWGGWGSNFIILTAGLQNIPKSLYEAANIDGCSNWKKTLNVTIPGIKGQLVLCLFTTIIGYMGLYGQNYVLSSGGPTNPLLSSIPGGGRTSTLIYFIQDIVANNANFKSTLYGLGAAASLIFALIVGILTGIQMYATRDKKTGFEKSREFEQWKALE